MSDQDNNSMFGEQEDNNEHNEWDMERELRDE